MPKKIIKKTHIRLIPLFDSIDHIKFQSFTHHSDSDYCQTDFEQAKSFLLSYDGNSATFNSYRREVEKLLQWAWLIQKKSIRDLKRLDIEEYIEFCQHPPTSWISLKKAPRFVEENGLRIANKEWRPFVSTVSKAAFRNGEKPNVENYSLSQKALQEIFTINSSFFNFLIQEEYTEINPILLLRQKSRYFVKVHGKKKIRRLSELQWDYVISMAESMAAENPAKHEKTLFIMTALYSMYLRISELTSSPRWTPKMCDFYRDTDGLWWFNVIGKGNKQRQISVSDTMLTALKRYRTSLNLTPLPSPTDATPLIPKFLGKGPISSTNQVRKIVQSCFDLAIENLLEDNLKEDADALLQATVHWLRHTGISDDVKVRPREHVRDDAGHSSSAITDKYIDIELRERHASAKNKKVKY